MFSNGVLSLIPTISPEVRNTSAPTKEPTTICTKSLLFNLSNFPLIFESSFTIHRYLFLLTIFFLIFSILSLKTLADSSISNPRTIARKTALTTTQMPIITGTI